MFAGTDASGHDYEGTARNLERDVLDPPSVVSVAIGETLYFYEVESVSVRLAGEGHFGHVTREVGALVLDETAG